MSVKPMRRPRGLDSLQMVVGSDREDTFYNGGPPPGYPMMRIKEAETDIIEPGLVYEHRLMCEGLLTAADKIESNEISTPAEGWDEGPMEFLTLHPELYEIGRQHPAIESLWLTDCKKTDINGQVWRVSAGFKGFVPLEGGGIKARKRRISVTVGTKTFTSTASLGYVPGSDPPRTPFVDENGVFNGWEDAKPTNLDVSRVTVVDTWISEDPPPTDKIPGCLTPEDPPPVLDILDDDWTFVDEIFWNWPHGWKIGGMQSEQLLDKEIWLITLTYEHVPKYDPK